VQKTAPPNPQESRWHWLKQYFDALHKHLLEAKIIIYSCLLIVVAASMFLHSFPQFHPPWQLLRWVVTILLWGVLFVPPGVTVFRRRSK
jgi:hypothetical protein